MKNPFVVVYKSMFILAIATAALGGFLCGVIVEKIRPLPSGLSFWVPLGIVFAILVGIAGVAIDDYWSKKRSSPRGTAVATVIDKGPDGKKFIW